jgi:hypothetical protein
VSEANEIFNADLTRNKKKKNIGLTIKRKKKHHLTIKDKKTIDFSIINHQ